MKKIISWLIGLIGVYVFVFMLPDHISRFALIYEKVFAGEYVRFFTYQFTHLNLQHLVENIFGILIIGLLTLELRFEPDNMFMAYLVTGIIAALPLWFFLHSTILGASTAIYGGYGISSAGSNKFGVNRLVVVLFICGIIFLKPIYLIIQGSDLFISTLLQASYHLLGLFGGLIVYHIWSKLSALLSRRQSKVLARVSYDCERVDG
ncbi:hypothetical protein COV93_05245 [Candidatus Woesearchaeota archaeon CG11_big_fil_rev_8_21_14_0_20_43_8]|nr:MAG: hypothetical protein COV93_05245 [Candidatus Woesearchaeota archaeon CG11_big_fil_rev_8_21_14_0_20_43_8]